MTSSSPETGGIPEFTARESLSTVWSRWRAEMPVTQRWAYFDHAAVAPIPERAAQAIREFASQASEQGDTFWPRWAAQIDELRRGTADWLNVDADEIALVPNTTAGINLVAEGMRWKQGDNVVIPGGEFPSNVFPWRNQERHGVEVRVVPSPGGRVDLDGIRRAVDSKTRVVASSWVGYASGYRVPLEDICQIAHSRGALFFLDAIQGLGIFPLDLREIPIDFLAADGHKWLLGPEGAGLAFVRKRVLDLLDCSTIGWNSVIGSYQFKSEGMHLKPTAARYEGGSANTLGLLALKASLELFWQVVKEEGPQAIENRVLELHHYAKERLKSLGCQILSDWMRVCRSGIVTFVPGGCSPEEARERLLKAGVVVSCRGGGVRASFHVYNTTEEIDRMLEVLSAS